jgi:hypothetical protein
MAPAVREGRRQQAIDGSCSSATNHQKRRDRKRKKVELITFSLLCSRPVHEQAELMMNHRDGHEHVGKDSKGCNASE